MGQDVFCQFYIVLGNREFRAPNDGNVYINATGVLDNDLIKLAIYRAYSKKNNENIKVGSEIIFLIPSMEFQTRCQEIVLGLDIKRSKIQILPLKRVEVQSQASVIEVNNIEQNSKSNNNDIVQTIDNNVSLEKVENLNVVSNSNLEQSVKSKNSYVYNPQNNFQSDFEGNGSIVLGGMVSEGPVQTQTQGNVKKLVKSQSTHKSAAFVSLPVIIFVLSAMLLIASLVLLYVLD